MKIMVLNLGSTSFKYKLFDMEEGERVLSSGGVENIGAPQPLPHPSAPGGAGRSALPPP